ncbi:DUF2972 domain-containing protein, partial [Campylobacter volucris]|uniref:DUF2972 domain-containing protein n=1 Tax=Campylobacter volucris TaxID=1031542 RepID=UPI0018A072C7
GESGSSHAPLVRFLKKCGVNMIHDHHELTDKEYFILNFNTVISNSEKCNILYIENAAFILESNKKYKKMFFYNNKIRDRFLYNLDKNILVLYTVKDPISRIATFTKRKLRIKNSEIINLNSNYDDIFNKNLFYPHQLDKLQLIDYIKLYKEGGMFEMSNTLEYIKNNNILYIDSNSLAPENAFNFIKSLSKILYFKEPTDESYFKRMITHKFFPYFPLKLVINNFIVYITYYKNDSKVDLLNLYNIEQIIFGEKIYAYTDDTLHEYISSNKKLEQKLYLFLNNTLNAFKFYFNNYLKNIRNEFYILNYLKNNKEARMQLKQILDKELAHIKQHRPDIVASWKYYQEFEKMCEKLDGEEKIEQKQTEK